MDPACKNTVVYRVIEEVGTSARQGSAPVSDKRVAELLYERLHTQGLLQDRPKEQVVKIIHFAIFPTEIGHAVTSSGINERIYDALKKEQMLR
jgi:hypothetical protein